MSIYQPYTYVVTHKATGKRYYGVRYARNCSPSDLWVSYFTSSKTIKNIIAREGIAAFQSEVRRTFATIEDARVWEEKVIRRIKAATSPLWFNMSEGNRLFFSDCLGRTFTKRSKARMSASAKKRCPSTRTRSETTRSKMSESLAGHAVSDETRQKISQALSDPSRIPYSKGWNITFPDGCVIQISNLSRFCSEHGLDKSNMVKVSRGKIRHHKGYRCELLA